MIRIARSLSVRSSRRIIPIWPATGAYPAEQRNAALVGGTGTGKSHLATGEPAFAARPWPLGVSCSPTDPRRRLCSIQRKNPHCAALWHIRELPWPRDVEARLHAGRIDSPP